MVQMTFRELRALAVLGGLYKKGVEPPYTIEQMDKEAKKAGIPIPRVRGKWTPALDNLVTLERLVKTKDSKYWPIVLAPREVLESA